MDGSLIRTKIMSCVAGVTVMGNLLETEQEVSQPHSQQRRVRSWAEVSQQTIEAAQQRRGVRENQLNIEANKIAKVRTPQRVQKLASLTTDKVKIGFDSCLWIEFLIDSKRSGEIVLELSTVLCKEDTLCKVRLQFSEGLGQSFKSKLLGLDEIVEGKEYSLVLKLVPTPKEGDKAVASCESSVYRLKRTTEVALQLEKQTIVFNNREFVYKSWFGASNEEDAEEESLCVVCLENSISTVISPCLHKCVCAICAEALSKQKSPCPLCRSPVGEFWVVNA